MTVGAKVTMPNGDFDVVNAFAPSYYLDIIQGVQEGQRAYNLPPGKSPSVVAIGEVRYRSDGVASFSVSGNIVVWSNLRNDTLIVSAV